MHPATSSGSAGPFENLAFALGAHTLAQLPPPGEWEVAFAGRSNAGKSSALNTLARRTRLAFVSKTPGRTQQINFFRVPSGGYLVDLPGYGYAKVPEAMKRHWEQVLERYLAGRESLRGLVLIMDARHPLTALDTRMLDWFAPTRRPVHILLSKADKLSKAEAARTLAAVQAELRARSDGFTAQLFSSTKRWGVKEAEATIAPWLSGAARGA